MKNRIERLYGGISYCVGEESFPLSTDSMLLGSFVSLGKNALVADLGSGSGALGLLLCGRYPDCRVTGVEIHGPSHVAAVENIKNNALDQRMESLLLDIREIRSVLPGGKFHCVVSNPPYFVAGADSQGPAGPQARKEAQCKLEDLYIAAKWLLRFGGDFYVVHKPDRLADLMALGRNHGLEPKKLRCVRYKPDAPVSLVLLQCRRGGKPGLQFLPDLILRQTDGTPTEEYQQIYHMD